MPRSDASYTWYAGPSDYSDVLTDDKRKCQVEGCHKKHAFSRPDGTRKVYSRYCAEHTCAVEYSESEGTHCQTPRKLGERYCSDHLKCGEPGCTKMGEYVHKVGYREYIRWFCTKHRCTAPDCLARAIDRQQQCCAAHLLNCGVPNCTRPAHRHRDGRIDAVCAVHYGTYRCLHSNCTRWTSARYCPSHKCAVPDCPSGRHTGTPNADACLKHLCTTPYCTSPVLYPARSRSAHCALHTCRAASCTSRRVTDPGAEFCLAHTCATPGCRAEARFPASHCARHACVVVTCPHPRLSAVPSSTLGVGLDRERCAAHAQARERRSASLGADDGIGLDWAGLRGRFEMTGERERERERKRLSEDLERLRRMQREVEAGRVWDDGIWEREGRAVRGTETERLQRDFEARGRRGSGWGAW